MSLEKSDLHRFLSGSVRNGIRRLHHPAHLGGSGAIPGTAHKIHQKSSTSELVKERHRRTGPTRCAASSPSCSEVTLCKIFFVVVRSFTAESNLLQPTGSVNSTPHTSHFLVDIHLMTRTCVAQVVSLACAAHISHDLMRHLHALMLCV